MTRPAHSALVLQGGGALGAYELGAARALYADASFAPDVIAGVSIGAVAVLLARPAGGRKPLEALEAFWKEVTVPGLFFPPALKPYASLLGNPNFFTPRIDYLAWPTWTYFYDTAPLRRALKELIDLDALADRNAVPIARKHSIAIAQSSASKPPGNRPETLTCRSFGTRARQEPNILQARSCAPVR